MEAIRTGLAEFFDWSSIMPARHIPPRHRYLSGRVASTKVPHAQAFESSLEQDFLLLLEFDRGVLRFASQPITIRWKVENRQRRYTPDVLVEYTPAMADRHPHLKPTLFEVKPEDVLKRDWAKLKPKFKAAIRWCHEYDCRFRIVTERYIRTPYLGNIKFLMQFGNERFRFADRHTQGDAQGALRSILFDLGRTTPQQLLDTITSDKGRHVELLPYIWHLVRCGAIGVDLKQPLTMKSPIWSLETGTQLAMMMGGEHRTRILQILEANHIEHAHG